MVVSALEQKHVVLCSWQVGLLSLIVSAALVAAPDLLQVFVHWRQEERQLHDDCDERGIQSVLWSNGEGPEAPPVEEHVVPGQEDVVAGGSDESHPPKPALDERKFPPGESGCDGGERGYAQHH